MKRIVASFDFDGTLTSKDSFLEFIKFSRGKWELYAGVFLYSPLLFLMKLGLYPNGKAKEKLFSHFFRGCDAEWFAKQGQAFVEVIEDWLNPQIVLKMESYLLAKHTVYVISASIEDWVRPWCKAHGVTNVMGTQVEIVDGKLTGRFSTPNCYGPQKVIRLLQAEPDRDSYTLYAYGDSRGDDAILHFADIGRKIIK